MGVKIIYRGVDHNIDYSNCYINIYKYFNLVKTKMTIYDIKKEVEKEESYFFSDKTLSFFNQFLSDFRIIEKDNKVFIIAPSVQYIFNKKMINWTIREYDNGQLLQVKKESVKGQLIEEYEKIFPNWETFKA